jgi:hypothetical protein
MAEKNLCNRRITPVKVHLFLESSGDELILHRHESSWVRKDNIRKIKTEICRK